MSRYYIGATHADLNERIAKHNTGEYGKHRYTAKTSDWELKLVIECENYSHAVRVERHIKKMKSRVFIEGLINSPERVDELKVRFAS